jgi:hypothetical protein
MPVSGPLRVTMEVVNGNAPVTAIDSSMKQVQHLLHIENTTPNHPVTVYVVVLLPRGTTRLKFVGPPSDPNRPFRWADKVDRIPPKSTVTLSCRLERNKGPAGPDSLQCDKIWVTYDSVVNDPLLVRIPFDTPITAA